MGWNEVVITIGGPGAQLSCVTHWPSVELIVETGPLTGGGTYGAAVVVVVATEDVGVADGVEGPLVANQASATSTKTMTPRIGRRRRRWRLRRSCCRLARSRWSDARVAGRGDPDDGPEMLTPSS